MEITVFVKPFMKRSILVLCILFCLIIPAANGGAISASLSSGVGSLETPPENISVFLAGTHAAVDERNWTGALLISTKGLAWYPDSADLLCLQGYTYRKTGQYEKSVELVSKGILLDPKPVRYANRGYGYLALGNYTAALADAETGLSLDNSYTTNYGVKALALSGLGRNSEALDTIEQGLAIDQGSAHSWHVEGRILTTMGNCTGAREALEKSLALDPGYSLPYPGFIGASQNLAALNATCIPATAQALPAPTKAATGWIAVIGIIGAFFAIGKKK